MDVCRGNISVLNDVAQDSVFRGVHLRFCREVFFGEIAEEPDFKGEISLRNKDHSAKEMLTNLKSQRLSQRSHMHFTVRRVKFRTTEGISLILKS